MKEVFLSDQTCEKIARSIQKLCESPANMYDGRIGVLSIVGNVTPDYQIASPHLAGTDLIQAGTVHQTGGIQENQIYEFVTDVRTGVKDVATRVELTSEKGALLAVTIICADTVFSAVGNIRIPTRE